jgi:hypothetical protein
MAKRLSISSKQDQLVLVGPKDSFKVSRLQRLSLNTDIPVTTIDEIGSASHVGNTKDIPNVTLSFSAFDVGIKIFSVLTGTDANAYPAIGVDIQSLGEVDAIILVKDPLLTDIVKTAHARRLQIRDFTYSYSVDGESTEDYTAAGSEKRWLLYDVVVDKFTTGASFTLTKTPIQLKNGNYALSVVVDGQYVTEVTGAPAAGQYRVVGTTLTTGDIAATQVLAVYHSNASATWADVSDPLLPVAIRGRDAVVKIAANSITRVQSVTINGTLNTTPVKEMGSRVITGYNKQIPTVEGTITVLDTDLELVNLFQYGVTTTSGYEWTPGEGCATNGVSLQIELLDPCDTTLPYEVKKTIYLDDISIVGDSWTSNVNADAVQTWNFRSNTARLAVYSGAKP